MLNYTKITKNQVLFTLKNVLYSKLQCKFLDFDSTFEPLKNNCKWLTYLNVSWLMLLN